MAEFNRKDHFYHKAKSEGYVARSAYKLIEIDKKFKVINPSYTYLDLGCAPGGWLQVLEQKRPQIKKIIGVDLLPLQFKPNAYTHFIQGDFLTKKIQNQVLDLAKDKINWVLSDLSPDLSGIKFKDNEASLNLCLQAYNVALEVLKPKGGLIVKIFPNIDLGSFKKDLKKSFQTVAQFKPDATRKTSNEVYLICRNFQS
jgi:23S rRNA (uridine2552-2'-O)-methyltransferase